MIAGAGNRHRSATRDWRPIRHPVQEMGERAAQRLLDRIDEPDLPRPEIVLPAEPSVRETCGAARGAAHQGT